MAIITCERCGAQTSKIEKCDHCKKKICYSCIKSQKRIEKTKRYFICKSCWSDMPSRKKFKSS
ncbi:MAG: hypothetical protein PHU63_02760 [Candidatus ainarchaeum sp.]|nr:hypothetical protein [Candidatus ainarchaeum sp.]